MCCIRGVKHWGKVCGASLAVSAVISSTFFFIWGILDIYDISSTSSQELWAAAVLYLIAAIKIIIGLSGFITVFKKAGWVAGCLVATLQVSTPALLVNFIAQWIMWILYMNGIQTVGAIVWKPSLKDIAQMLRITIFNISFLVAAYWIISTFRSLQMVLDYTGTGWEKKNYKEIKLELGQVYSDEESPAHVSTLNA